MQGLVDQAFTDPAHITAATFDQYLIGNAKTLFDAALYNEKQAGRYYQGTPDLQRVRVCIDQPQRGTENSDAYVMPARVSD